MNRRAEVVNNFKNSTVIEFVEGFDEAIIGSSENCEDNERVVYDKEKIIEILITKHNMNYVNANEFYENNILACYYGKRSPLFFKRLIKE